MANLKELLDYSAANPDSDIAVKTRRAIEGGAYDQEAADTGIDLSWAGRPKLAASPKITTNFANTQKPKPGFETGITKVDPTGAQSKALIEEAPPVIGAVGGAVLGGIAGAPLGPAGVYAGGVAGATAGAAAGETVKQGIQVATGQRDAVDPLEVGKTGLEYGALEAVGGPLASVTGKVLKVAGGTAAKAFIPTSAKEAKLLQNYKANTTFFERMKTLSGMGGKNPPVTAGQTAFDRGFMGTQSMIGVQAKRDSNTIWNDLIGPALKQTKAEVDMPVFFKQLEDDIMQKTPELTRRKELLNALEAMKEDYAGVASVSLEQLQKFKEGWAKFIPDKAYKGMPIAGAFRDVQNLAAGRARQTIYEGVGDPGIRQAYLDYGNLQGLQQLGQTAMTGAKLKGGSFTGLHAIWDMATIPVGTVGGQTIYKVGQGIEILGAPGARTVRAALGIPLGFGSETGQSDAIESLQNLQ